MKLSKTGFSIVGGLLLSPLTAMSADMADKDAATGRDVKFSAEFRAGLTYDDQGFMKTEGVTPEKKTTIALEKFKLQFRGNLENDLEYRVRLDARKIGTDKSSMEYGYIKWNATKMFSVLAGQDKVAQNGVYEKLDTSYRFYAPFNVNGYKNTYQHMIAGNADLGSAGTFTLQLFDDQNLKDEEARDFSKDGAGSHPTYAFQWSGKFGGLKPLVQAGAYDNQKSNWFSVGTLYEFGPVGGHFNTQITNNAYRDANDKEVKDTLTGIELEVYYNVTKSIAPYLYIANFDNKQAGTDLKVNSAAGVYDDNGQLIVLGVNMQETEVLKTYFGVEMKSGKFSDLNNKEETRTNTSIKIGISAITK